MSGYVKRRANNQRRRMLTKKWKSGWRTVDQVPVAMELNGRYKSLDSVMIRSDGSFVITGIDEKGVPIEETSHFQNSEVTDFDEMLRRYGLKSLLRSLMTTKIQIAHVRAKSTIRELGEDLQEDLIRGPRADVVLLDEVPGARDWEQALENARNELTLEAVIKDLNKLEEEMNIKKPAKPAEEKSICENCGEEVPENEIQSCEKCGVDGLGNCCIGIEDHVCDDAEEEDEG